VPYGYSTADGGGPVDITGLGRVPHVRTRYMGRKDGRSPTRALLAPAVTNRNCICLYFMMDLVNEQTQGRLPLWGCQEQPHTGFPWLSRQRSINPLLGRDLSATLRAVSAPATGNPRGSSKPS
jgi:hypothetical protein